MRQSSKIPEIQTANSIVVPDTQTKVSHLVQDFPAIRYRWEDNAMNLSVILVRDRQEKLQNYQKVRT